MRQLRPAIILTLLASIALAGCARHSATPGKTLRVINPAEPKTLDPALVTDGPSIQVLNQVLEGLVQFNSKNEIVPCLAERWEVSPDGLSYTFHLRPGVRFHNGRELTAEDVAYSINRALALTTSTTAALYLDDLVGAQAVLTAKAKTAEGVQVVDPHTIRLVIDKPKAYFLAKLTYPTAYVVCREEVEAGGQDWTEAPGGGKTHYVGTGPFKLVEWQHGARVSMVANDQYWEGRPKADGLEFLVVEDAATRMLKYENGEADIVEAELSDYPRLKKDAKLSKEVLLREEPGLFYLGLNQTFPPFKDARVRRAFAEAIDKDQIIRVILAGVCRRAEGILPPGIPGYDAALRGPKFDPKAAQALLAEAGFPGGKGFPALTLTYGRRRADTGRVCQVIADMLKTNLGIPVGVQEMEWGAFLGATQHSRIPFYNLTWFADYLDPQDFLSIMLRSGTANNRTGYSNSEFDRLVDSADVSRDPKARVDLYRQAERVMVADQPWIPLNFGTVVFLVKPRVHGLETNLMGILPHKRTEVGS